MNLTKEEYLKNNKNIYINQPTKINKTYGNFGIPSKIANPKPEKGKSIRDILLSKKQQPIQESLLPELESDPLGEKQ